MDWPEFERMLPDRGLPRGVVELAFASGALSAFCGGATTVALRALRAIHKARAKAWCAWVSPIGVPSLYAPSLVQAGVDLSRLLVVHPDGADLARTTVKVGGSGAFDLVVVDAVAGLSGSMSTSPQRRRSPRAATPRVGDALVVRKLALASEQTGTTVVLLTDMHMPRPVSWPVALRLELERRPEAIAIRVAKDRYGRTSSPHVVRIAS